MEVKERGEKSGEKSGSLENLFQRRKTKVEMMNPRTKSDKRSNRETKQNTPLPLPKKGF